MQITLIAHAGHGHTEGGSLLHQIAEPVHLGILLASVALVVGVGWLLRQYSNMRLEAVRRRR